MNGNEELPAVTWDLCGSDLEAGAIRLFVDLFALDPTCGTCPHRHPVVKLEDLASRSLSGMLIVCWLHSVARCILF